MKSARADVSCHSFSEADQILIYISTGLICPTEIITTDLHGRNTIESPKRILITPLTDNVHRFWSDKVIDTDLLRWIALCMNRICRRLHQFAIISTM